MEITYPYCLVQTPGFTLVDVNLEPCNTIAYAKTVACSAWDIEETQCYYLKQVEPTNGLNSVWCEDMVIPDDPIHVFVLELKREPLIVNIDEEQVVARKRMCLAPTIDELEWPTTFTNKDYEW